MRENRRPMNNAHLQALLAAAEAKPDDDGWQAAAEGRALTLHLAHDGVSLTVSRVTAVKVDANLLHARTAQGDRYVLEMEDLFAGAIEPPRSSSRKAGFV